MNDIFENTETMKKTKHPRFYTAESVMRGHPDKLCDLIADSVLDAVCSMIRQRVACEVMATHGHIIVAGEITTSAKPDVFNIVRDVLRDVGYDPKATKSTATSTTKAPTLRALSSRNWLRERTRTPSVQAIRALWSLRLQRNARIPADACGCCPAPCNAVGNSA